jgi:MerR family transcriptional regulator, redox-sensitive transcriptional activator SoxR
VAGAETTLSISEVAAASGLRPSALRYYEEVELISPVGRRGGRRHYRPDVVARLGLVALAQDVGFTVAEIRALLDGHAKEKESWREMTGRKLGEIELQMEKLQAMKRLLQAAAACECAGVDGCEFIEAAAERRRSGQRAPAVFE